MASASDNCVSISNGSGTTVVIAKSFLYDNSPVIKNMLKTTVIVPRNILTLLESADRIIQLKRLSEKRDIELNSVDHAIDIYKFSQYYKIKKLAIECRKYLKSHITPENLCTVHSVANQQEDRLLEFFCWKKFDEMSENVLQTEQFARCDECVLKTIVSRPRYKTLKEITLFQNLIRWATAKLQQQEISVEEGSDSYNATIRHYLNPFFDNIRFLSMNEEELDIVYSYNILSPEEKQCIFAYTEETTLLSTICSTTNKRTNHCYELLIEYENRFNARYNLGRRFADDTEFFSLFTIKENCFLCDILLPIYHYHYTGDLLVKIKIEANGIPFHIRQYTCKAIGHISLPEPIFLKKDVKYFVVAMVDATVFKTLEIRISQTAEFFIDRQRFDLLQRRKHLRNRLQWHKYFIKIRLYF